MKPCVYVIATGGTIASKSVSQVQATGYSELSFDADALIGCIPGIAEQVELKAQQLFSIDSSDMTDERLLQLAQRINQVLQDDSVDGVVVTHGTDTMEETAFFLNLTVRSNKPVVLTGAMRPTTVLSADGPMNLYNAILAAADPQSRGKGVVVCMNDQLLPGRDVIKTSTCRVDAFGCAEYGCLGTVVGGKARYSYGPLRPHTEQSEFDVSGLDRLPRVEIVYTHISCEDTMLRAAVERGCDGVVIAGTGSGSAPEAIRNFCKAHKGKLPVVRASRVMGGRICPSGLFADETCGTIPAGDLPPHKARILLQLALTQTTDLDQLRRIFQKY